MSKSTRKRNKKYRPKQGRRIGAAARESNPKTGEQMHDSADNGPKIDIPGFMMLLAPELTVQEAFSNFEELARGAGNIGSVDRLRLLQSLKVLGDLVGHLPTVTLDEAVDNFDVLAAAHSCTRPLQMALLQSVKILKALVDVEKTRLAEETEKAKGADGKKDKGPVEGTD